MSLWASLSTKPNNPWGRIRAPKGYAWVMKEKTAPRRLVIYLLKGAPGVLLFNQDSPLVQGIAKLNQVSPQSVQHPKFPSCPLDFCYPDYLATVLVPDYAEEVIIPSAENGDV